MLRGFRNSDTSAYAELYRKHFPEESQLLLADAPAFRKIIERLFRWDARLILGLLRWIGRPVGRFFALEVDGKLAGVTFLVYDGPVGYLTSVVVDTPYQHRGFAKMLVGAAERAAARQGKRYTILDVISTNEPARQLYLRTGYSLVRRVGWFYRDLGEGLEPLPAALTDPTSRGLRPFERTDGIVLAAIAQGHQPEAHRTVRPIEPRAFRIPPLVVQAIGGETEGIVHTLDGRPAGFVRMSRNRSMASGNLSAPVLDDALTDEAALALLDQGLAWFRGSSVRRILCELPEDDLRAVRLIESRGFRRGIEIETLAKPIS